MRNLIKTAEYDRFFASLPENVKAKLDYVANIIIQFKVVNTKFVKKLENSEYYEMRISVENEYRVLLYPVDNQNLIEAQEILMLNGFLKKSTKDYKKQIAIADGIIGSLSMNAENK